MESQNGHVRVDILINRFPKKIGKALHGFLLVITAAFIFIIFYAVAGNITTIYSRGAATTVLHIPHWPFYIVIVVGLFVYALTVLFHGFEKFGEIKTVDGEQEGIIKDVDVTTQM
jgi:TRAP-type C4-dicarboxylate transport system permease small subunit